MKKSLLYWPAVCLVLITAGGVPAATVDVSIRDSFFDPEQVTVQVGDTVRWTHGGFLTHTATSDAAGLWDSGFLSFGAPPFSITFTSPGIFPYHCTIHRVLGMTGTIEVVVPQPETLPLPEAARTFSYDAVQLPVGDTDPASALPVGFGEIAAGGSTLTVRIKLENIAGPADIFGAYIASSSPSTVNILNPDGRSFSPFALQQIVDAITSGTPPPGAVPWMSGASGTIEAELISLSAGSLPSGTYTAYLLLSPAGSLSTYYLWTTFFIVP